MAEIIVDTTDESPVSRVLTVAVSECLEIAKALSTQLRLDIFLQLLKRPMNVAEIAEMFELPVSTAAANIKRLEDAGLILAELVPGTRGTQKLCATVFSRIVIEMGGRPKPNVNVLEIPMPIGQYVNCEVSPTCGLVSTTGIIGELDDPGCFYEPERSEANLLWFRSGFVEYRFPKRLRATDVLQSIELTMEVCSEAPLHNHNWPSDITVWINDREVGTWTSPGDFGGEKGYLTPDWWGLHQTQYGILKTWRVTDAGAFVDGRQVSEVKLTDLNLDRSGFISVRIGVKPDSQHVGGMNLFGKHFGNYETDLVMRLFVEHPGDSPAV